MPWCWRKRRCYVGVSRFCVSCGRGHWCPWHCCSNLSRPVVSLNEGGSISFQLVNLRYLDNFTCLSASRHRWQQPFSKTLPLGLTSWRAEDERWNFRNMQISIKTFKMTCANSFRHHMQHLRYYESNVFWPEVKINCAKSQLSLVLLFCCFDSCRPPCALASVHSHRHKGKLGFCAAGKCAFWRLGSLDGKRGASWWQRI